MFSSWFSATAWRGARIQLVDDVEAGACTEKTPCSWHGVHPSMIKQASNLSSVAVTTPIAAITASALPRASKEPLLDRYTHLLDPSTISFTPSAEDGHWLLGPPGSMRYWAWMWVRVVLLVARLGACWLVLAAVEALAGGAP